MSKAPILIFGANGQVGGALKALLGDQAIALSSREADFTDPQAIEALLTGLLPVPRAIINAAAYTQVDKAESEEALALAVNAETPGVIARYAAAHAIPFIHYSTDYVFAGTGSNALKESDPVDPQNAYGRTKLQGEENIRKEGGRWLIFRTSWVYDDKGKNFLNTMLRLGKEREHLRVVNDQFGAPTYAPALAEATLAALENATQQPDFPSGIYHLSGGGLTNWHEFAKAIFQEAAAKGITLAVKELEGIPTSAYPTPAKRPANSQLDCSRASQVLQVSLPDWRVSLKECMGRVSGG